VERTPLFACVLCLRLFCQCWVPGCPFLPRRGTGFPSHQLSFSNIAQLQTVTATRDYTQFPNGVEPEESHLSTPPLRDYLHPQKPSFLSRRLFVTLVNYAFLSFLDASLYATFPLLLASPIASGGLNFAPKTIGYILGAAALFHALIQALGFPSIIRRWDAKNVYVASIIAYVFLFLTMPILNALAHQAGHVTPAIWGLLFMDIIACFSSYSAYS
jgi:hypothetical protein